MKNPVFSLINELNFQFGNLEKMKILIRFLYLYSNSLKIKTVNGNVQDNAINAISKLKKSKKTTGSFICNGILYLITKNLSVSDIIAKYYNPKMSEYDNPVKVYDLIEFVTYNR